MDFLNNAIFSATDRSFLGAVITSFDTSVYTSRAEVKLVTAAGFETLYDSLKPMGFKYESNGMLYSDTESRKVLTEDMFKYVDSAYKDMSSRTLDLIDLVLYCATYDGWALPDWKQSGEQSYCIKMNKFKVSNSSFNIYAPYRLDDGTYRAHSLLNVEDGSPCENYIALPKYVSVDKFKDMLTEVSTMNIDDVDMTVYKVSAGLGGFNVSVGEAFLNYLAYNVAYYNIGEQILNTMLNTLTPKEETPKYVPRQDQHREVRYNVSIVHEYKKNYLTDVQENSKDFFKLAELIKANPEMAVTYYWLRTIYTSNWYNDAISAGKDNDAAILSACQNLRIMCQTTRMKYALELLAHRYYLFKIGYQNDTIGYHIKGGGVNGESIKRFTM